MTSRLAKFPSTWNNLPSFIQLANLNLTLRLSSNVTSSVKPSPTQHLLCYPSHPPHWRVNCPRLVVPRAPITLCNELMTSASPALHCKPLDDRDLHWFIFASLHHAQYLKHSRPLGNMCWTNGNDSVLPFTDHFTCVKHETPLSHHHTTTIKGMPLSFAYKEKLSLERWSSLPKSITSKFRSAFKLLCLITPFYC